MKKILLIEDELNLQKSLAEYLSKEGFILITSSSLNDAETALVDQPDLILLDWMLPDGQGIELIKKWRATGNMIPIILLTARSELIDKVLGLELGANDYLTKPFEPRELLARIHVQIRLLGQKENRDVLTIANIKFVTSSREVFYLNNKLELTKTEYDLLKIFVENPNKVFSREELLNQVWGYDRTPTTRTVDTHILQLRQKTHPELFETMHGVGYRFRAKL